MKWERVILGDYIDILSGYPFESKLFSESEGTPLIRIRDVVRGYTNTFYKGDFDKSYLVKRGDILVGMDGEFNTAKWSSEPALLNQRVCKITTKNSTKISEKYLFHLLPKKLKEIEDRTSFVTVKHLSVKNINAIEIDLPPLSIQQQIADTLDKADALRRKDQELLDKYDELAKAVFYEMLGDPVRNEKGWEKKTLSDVCSKLTVGFVGVCEKFYTDENGIPLLRTGNIGDGQLIMNKLKYVTEEFHIKNKKSQVGPGDVLIARHGDNGKACMIRNEIPEANVLNAVILRPNNSLYHSRLLVDLFNNSAFRLYMSTFTGGATQKVINTKALAKLVVITPPIDIQIEYANRINYIDNSKAYLYQIINNSENLFQNFLKKHF
ncbi:MAG TPA: restriction endonuclease subunit S [Chitinophagaceae bacterium]|nr:restriction endonuclease subunit S [Chitinophagaceae bacterium]